MNSANAQAYYLLGFAPLTNGLKALPVPPILAQLRIENRSAAGIAAWYRAVARHEFEGPEASRNLADLNWLTPRVLAHESVVSKLNELFPIYPARFGCLFSSLDLLMQTMVVNRTILEQFFANAAERQEWGIKFTVNLDNAVQEAAKSELAKPHMPMNGLSYLKLKQLERTMRSPVLQLLHSRCDERIDRLRDAFKHVVVRPNRSLVQPDRETLLANVAVWVPRDQTEKLVAMCEPGIQTGEPEQTIEICTTGPWPPYSFARLWAKRTFKTGRLNSMVAGTPTQEPLLLDLVAFVVAESFDPLMTRCAELGVDVCSVRRYCASAGENLYMVYERAHATGTDRSLAQVVSDRMQLLQQLVVAFDVLPIRYRPPIAQPEFCTWLDGALAKIIVAVEKIRGCEQYEVRWAVPDQSTMKPTRHTGHSALDQGQLERMVAVPVSGKAYLLSRRQACSTLWDVERDLGNLQIQSRDLLSGIAVQTVTSLRQVNGRRLVGQQKKNW